MAFLNFNKLALEPTIKDTKLFINVNYKDDINSKLIINKNIFFYILNPKKFYNDFYATGWKIGFLKNILKIRLPYYKIYAFFKK